MRIHEYAVSYLLSIVDNVYVRIIKNIFLLYVVLW